MTLEELRAVETRALLWWTGGPDLCRIQFECVGAIGAAPPAACGYHLAPRWEDGSQIMEPTGELQYFRPEDLHQSDHPPFHELV